MWHHICVPPNGRSSAYHDSRPDEGPSMSRLRERLKTISPATSGSPAAPEAAAPEAAKGARARPEWERCEIVTHYVSGSITLQYRFRAVAQRGTMTYTAGSSP